MANNDTKNENKAPVDHIIESAKKLDRDAKRLKTQALRGDGDDRIATQGVTDNVADKSWSTGRGVIASDASQDATDNVTTANNDGTTNPAGTVVVAEDNNAVTGSIIPVSPTPDSTPTYNVLGNHVSNYGGLTLTPTGAFVFVPSAAFVTGQSQQFTVQTTNQGVTTQQQLVFTHTATTAGGPQNVAVNVLGGDSAVIVEDHNVQAGFIHAVGHLDTLSNAPIKGNAIAETLSGHYGSLTINKDGDWDYSVDDHKSSIQSLKTADTLQEKFTVTLVDGTHHQIAITIKGDEDKAIISGVDAKPLIEDINVDAIHHLDTQGKLDVTDLDHDDAFFQAQTTTGAYGEFSIDDQGHWQYSVDDNQNSIQSLAAGEKATETIHVLSKDGGTTHDVVITITGTNDAPVISSGVQTGAVVEDGTLTAQGQVTATDVDHGAVLTYSTPNLVSTYGSFTLDSSTGTWGYSLDNANHQDLAAGETHTDTITVTVTDENGATTTQDVSVTITGTNDAPVISSGVQTGAVVEDGTLTAQGQVTATDVDHGAVLTYSTPNLVSTYGSFTLDSSTGTWGYSLDNANHQDLAAGETHTDTITVTVTDENGATTTQDVTVTITGTNDAPVITGTTTGDLTEDATTPTLTVSDQLHITDADTGEAHFQVQTAAASDNGYGEFTITDDGHWTYTADNLQPAIQSLAEGQPLTDTITVLAADGTPTVLTVTITGTNDAPELTLTPDAAQPFTGTLTETDVDTTDTHTFTTTQGVGAFGTLTVDPATGDYVYTQTPGTVKGMAYDHNTGQYSGQDVFEVQVADNHGGTDIKYVTFDVSATMSGPTAVNPNTPVTVHVGTPTAPTITTPPTTPTTTTATPTNTVDLDLATASDTHGAAGTDTDDITSVTTPTITGHVDIPFSTVTLFDGTTKVGTVIADDKGDYSVDTSTLSGTEAGQVHHLHAEATAPGATGVGPTSSTPLDVTIDTGATTAPDAATATEDQVAAATSGNVLGNDESGMAVSNAGDLSSPYGTLHLAADGSYTFDLDNAHASALAAGKTATQEFTYEVTDVAGNTAHQTLSITITGTNDAPVITGTTTGDLTEDATTPTLTVSDQLHITDADTG
ncbi:hypothetical protein E2R68_13310, partial [Psychromonas sp. RZ22]|uniref:VCBS domain-containing protein n=1 Tax=Psychromonas algarum TaxID=2555643 RepID=UPI001103BB0E